MKRFLIIPLLPILFISFCPSENATGASIGEFFTGKKKSASRVYRRSADGHGALTRKMIEDCIVLKRDIETSGANLDKSRSQLISLKQELDQLAFYLKGNKETIDHTNSDAVSVYNIKVALYKETAEKYTSLQKDFNSKVEAHRQNSLKFDQQCRDQKYYPDDYEKAVKNLGYGFE